MGTIWSKFVCSGDSRIVYFVLISRCSVAGISKLDLGGGGGRGKGKVKFETGSQVSSKIVQY